MFQLPTFNKLAIKMQQQHTHLVESETFMVIFFNLEIDDTLN
jgi:hypothetical protein